MYRINRIKTEGHLGIIRIFISFETYFLLGSQNCSFNALVFNGLILSVLFTFYDKTYKLMVVYANYMKI